MRKTIVNTDQKLSKASADIDSICKTVYGGYNIGDEISEDLFLSLPKAEVNSLKELRVEDGVLISEGNKCTYAVLNEKIASNGNTKLIFVTGHDNEHPVFKTYHFKSEWNWIHHAFHILPIGALNVQKLNIKIAHLQNNIKANISAIASTDLSLKAHKDQIGRLQNAVEINAFDVVTANLKLEAHKEETSNKMSQIEQRHILSQVNEKMEKLGRTVTRRANEFSSSILRKATYQMETQIKSASKSNELKNKSFQRTLDNITELIVARDKSYQK